MPSFIIVRYLWQVLGRRPSSPPSVSSPEKTHLNRVNIINLNFYIGFCLKLMMMVMMNCFCGMVDRRKTYSLISSRDHCQKFSRSRISRSRSGLNLPEPKFRFSWTKPCSSDNHYTMAPLIFNVSLVSC